MASSLFIMSYSKLILLLIITFSSLHFFYVSSLQFDVGATDGWTVPPANDTKIYNKWASKNRFQIGDSIHFKYGKDSVMLVTELDYKECNSTHPFFFSNNGDTVFKFDRSGLFYFISGVSGHCERGQKMIIKVMAPEDTPSSGGDDSSSSSGVVSTSMVILQFALSFLGSLLL